MPTIVRIPWIYPTAHVVVFFWHAIFRFHLIRNIIEIQFALLIFTCIIRILLSGIQDAFAAAASKVYDDNSQRQAVRDNATLRLFVAKQLPLSLLDSQEWKLFCHTFDEKYTTRCSKYFTTTLLTLKATQIRERLRRKLARALAFSLTMDLWSAHRRHYLGMTVHAVDETFKLQEFAFDLDYFPEKHTTVNIYEHLAKAACEYVTGGLHNSAFVSLTTDTTNNVKALRSHIDVPWLPCFNHVTSLFVHDVIDERPTDLDAMRELALKFRNERAFINALEVAQGEDGVPVNTISLDCETRWNSFYDMLVDIYANKVRIQRILDEQNAICADLQPYQWQIMKSIIDVMKIFKLATLEMSESKGVTMSKVAVFIRRFWEAIQVKEGDNDICSSKYTSRFYLTCRLIFRLAASCIVSL